MAKPRVFRTSEQGRQVAEVISYAPGDGNLSFVVRDLATGEAVGRPTREECEHLLLNGWELFQDGSDFRARRVAEAKVVATPTAKQCHARSEAYREAADHLLLAWTDDPEERAQGNLVAEELRAASERWLQEGDNREKSEGEKQP